MPPGAWNMTPAEGPAVYLTFDDGPHPEATPFVLDQLSAYDAKGTFFCIGKNVLEYPEIYERILREGHRVGNHTHNHLNGWKTKTRAYVEDTCNAARCIDTDLFRPPYGRIRPAQARHIREAGYKLIYWSLLSGDFDKQISPGRCLENVAFHLRPGDIVVFHDSRKAWERLRYALPRVLELCKRQHWEARTL